MTTVPNQLQMTTTAAPSTINTTIKTNTSTAATTMLQSPPPPSQTLPPQPSGGMPPTATSTQINNPAAPPPRPLAATADQQALVKAILHADVDALFTKFNKTDWNFNTPVIGRTAPQTPLGLLLRPELNYGNLSRMSKTDQYRLVQHVLSLPEGYTPRLDSLDQKPGPFRQTMSSSVLQAVYQGRVDLIELLYDTALERARQGTGVAFDLREKFFPSKITLLHMSAHDGRTEMSKWIIRKWAEEAERDPGSLKSKEFHPDVLDGGGQTPLFWTFARGSVSVDLARYLVDECQCDFFKVFRLKPETGSNIVPYSSPFSLAIQLAPEFVEEQLQKKTTMVGTRFQYKVMKHDFKGITLQAEQIQKIQDQVDFLNAQEAENANNAGGSSQLKLEGKEFLNAATNLLKAWVKEKKSEIKKSKNGSNVSAGSSIPLPSPRGGKTTTASSTAVTSSTTDGAAGVIPLASDELDISELRFVSQEPIGNRPPKDRWDGFYYDNVPLSAVELMVRHNRTRLLLTPITLEIQDRLWTHLQWRYWFILTCYSLFGILFAINTGIWPKTSEMIGSNVIRPLTPIISQTTWLGLYFTCNIVCIGLSLLLFIFHFKAIYEGANTEWRGSLKQFYSAFRENVKSAFRSGSSRLDLAILACFILVQFIQWSMVCHVQQFSDQPVCSNKANQILDEDTLSALGWLSSILHLLLGMKLLELISIFEFAGPLLTTLIGMFRDVGKFLILFGIGYLAFMCALWIVLKDINPPEVSSGLNVPGSLVTTGADGTLIEPQPRYSYSSTMVSIILWVFVSFDYDSFNHMTLNGVAHLGRCLFLMFLLIMVLVMLNLMIAMFSHTYSKIVEDAKGEWHIRFCSVLCQLLRMSGSDGPITHDLILEMGVDNNCGLDRLVDDSQGGESGNTSGGGGSHADTDALVTSSFQYLNGNLNKLRGELKELRTLLKRTATTTTTQPIIDPIKTE